MHVDPIEKKPLNHFFPATSIFSIATTGCNFRCLNCQNWEISQKRPEDVRHSELFPADVVREAKERDTHSIAYTYSEAITYYEYMYDTATRAREAGLKNVLVSNGYINKGPLLRLAEYLDGANINLKSLQEGTKAALAAKKIQQTVLLPTLSVTYRFRHNYEEKSSFLFGVTSPQNQYTFVSTLTQPIFAGFSLVNQYEIAKMGLDGARYNEKLYRHNVIFEAKRAYFSLLKMQKLLEVSELAVKQLEAHKTVANNFYEVGMIPLNDLLKAQVELANIKQNLIVVQNGIDLAKSNLNLILRQDINAPIVIVDITSYTPFYKDIDYCLKQAEKNRLEIKMTDLDIRIKEKELKISKKDFLPSINLQANYYRLGTAWDAKRGSGISDPSSWEVGAVSTWNLWECGRS